MTLELVLGFGMFAALIIACLAMSYARSADQFADKCHGRMNGIMEKFSRLDYDLERIKAKVKGLEYEVLGVGRSGVYPDMGLRDWARVWRGRLRQDMIQHQHPTVAQEVTQEDVRSLDDRIDTISELRHLDSQDLQAGKAAHNQIVGALAALVDHLGLEYTDQNTFVKRPKK